jgi:kynurenine formamidase
MPLLDLTHTITHGMTVFPGEVPPSIIADELPANAGYATFRLESNMHTGTHMDAPYHVLADDKTMDSYPVELFCGKATVIDVSDLHFVHMQDNWIDIFSHCTIILFHTGHTSMWGKHAYYHDYPVFEDKIAMKLVEAGVRIVGFDSPSPDRSPYHFHSIYLKENRFMIENLTNLGKLVDVKEFELMVFPLKIEAEASLVRAVAKY